MQKTRQSASEDLVKKVPGRSALRVMSPSIRPGLPNRRPQGRATGVGSHWPGEILHDRKSFAAKDSRPPDGTIAVVSRASNLSVPSSQRGRWRFAGRALLVVLLVTVTAIVAALGWHWQRARRQAAIVLKLRTTGLVEVRYDYEFQALGEGPWGRGTIVPPSLRRLCGDDFFSDVHLLSIGKHNYSPPADYWKAPLGPRGMPEDQCREILALAAPLGQIRSLWINDAVVRGDALAQLTCWEQVTFLRIDGCNVRDEDLAVLSRAVNLREAQLEREPISDAALAYLQNSPRLRFLQLQDTNVTLAGVDQLPSLDRSKSYEYLREQSKE